MSPTGCHVFAEEAVVEYQLGAGEGELHLVKLGKQAGQVAINRWTRADFLKD